jgi:hypothetical protein
VGGREVRGDIGADLAGPDDDHVHERTSLVIVLPGPQRAKSVSFDGRRATPS